jgi:CHAD domain-containing protein
MSKSAADEVRAALRAQQAALAAHEAGAQRGADPEELRQMRTAVRRLRAAVRDAPSMFGPDPAPVARELHWLGAVLGGIRDLDVFRDYLRTELPSLPAVESAVARRVLAHLEAERTRAQRGVAEALASPRYARLRKGLAKALGRRPRRGGDDPSLPDAARRRFKKLRKAVDALPSKPSDEQLHAIRIRLKRARYAAELAEVAIGRPARRFARTAGRLQDILGEHQDAVVAEARLRALGTPGERGLDGPGLQRLIDRQHRRRRAAWRAFQEQWPKLERRGRKALH